MVKIEIYSKKYKSAWDEFISRSKNGTFLFYRDYMEYHADRFIDHSLLFFDGNKLVAVLPANIKSDILYSHQGLTYGGLVTDSSITTPAVLTIFNELNAYLREINIARLYYKAVPHIYHLIPAEEDLYALFMNNAILIKREVSTSFLLSKSKISYNRRRGAKKAINSGVTIKISRDIEKFLQIVNERLSKKYSVSAVHTVNEMILLMERFPKNIKFFGAYKNDTLIGGAIIYESQNVAHAQYLFSDDVGRQLRTMDHLIVYLLTDYYKDKQWFDFGHSTEAGGRFLNKLLITQKEEFGGSAICYDTYELNIGK